MTKPVIKQIFANIKDAMKEKGFKKEGQTYIRVVNGQVCQSVNFQGFSGGDRFTLNVGLNPLCANIIANPKFIPAFIRIGYLLGTGDKWWDYTNESVNTVTDIILNILLPFFDRCDTYQGIFEEIKDEISPDPHKSYNLFNAKTALYICIRSHLHVVCISVGEYDKAIDCITHMLHFYEDSAPERAIELNNLANNIKTGNIDRVLKKYRELEQGNLSNLKKYVV